MHPDIRSNERGVALALAIIASLLLFIITFEVAMTVRVEQFISHNIEVDTKLEVGCQAGFEVALANLRQDRQETEIDSQNDVWYPLVVHQELREADVASDEFLFLEDDDQFDQWSEDVSGLTLYIKTFDEAAKFNVYLLLTEDNKLLRRRKEMFANVIDRFREDTDLDLSSSDGERLADAVREFLKRGDEEQSSGPPKPPTKKPETLTDVFELLYCEGITPDIMYDQLDEYGDGVIPGLFRYITVWSDMQININTADVAGLSGLFTGANAYLAERIDEYRLEAAEENARGANDAATTGSFDPSEQETDPTGGAAFTQVNELRERSRGSRRRSTTTSVRFSPSRATASP